MLLTPSGGQTGSPAAARRGRGAAARQMAAFTYSWESPLGRGLLAWASGASVMGVGGGRLRGWLCFGEGNILEHAGIHTHTEVHKEHWIFVLSTQGYIHPWTFHTQTPAHTNPQSFTASRRPYHVHKHSHLEAPAQTTKSQVPTSIQELTFTHSPARRSIYTATAISESHTTMRSWSSSFSHAAVCMRPPPRLPPPHTQS